MQQTDYKPINCSYYDELEAIATLKKKVRVEYFEEKTPVKVSQVGIINLFTRNKEEFVVLSNGLTIRLDRLISVDGKPIVLSC
jgi:Rho-binding antiterminator